MKVILLTIGAAVLLIGAAYASEPDHAGMHETMMKGGAPSVDDRIELKLPQTMKVMQKGMMRAHLSTIAEITAALAANDLGKAASSAGEKLGWTRDEEERCARVEEMTGQKDFVTLGKAMHAKADELAVAAKAGDRDLALKRLSELITNCNACHEKYRH
jgi:cytochrome c556